MKYMAVVECISSGHLYINDIISHGYRPLVINPKGACEYDIAYREAIKKGIRDKADYIDEDDDFDVFISKLKKYDIAAVFVGSETGVRLTDRIVKALGLRGNDCDTVDYRCTKAGMFEALDKAGLRRIETKKVACRDDIKMFWEEHGLSTCVLKFSESNSAVGLKVCQSLDDALEYYEVLKGLPNAMGRVGDDILIQECVSGTEYVVDTLSCNGEHMVTDIWVYQKVRTADGAVLYDYAKLVKDLEPGHVQMIQYLYSVLDAVDMKWGPCHSEVMVDRNGPVLIEVNARPLGLAMTDRYLDEFLGHHITDMAVDTYLDPSRFEGLKRRVYSPPKYAMLKMMIVPEDIVGSLGPLVEFANMIRSTREILIFGDESVRHYGRTIDLETSPITIKMVNEDYGELMKDYEIFRKIESTYFDLLYTVDDSLEGSELRTGVNAIMAQMDLNRRFVLVTDSGTKVYQYGEVKDSEEIIYDGAVFAVCGKMTARERYRAMFKTMHNLRSGGLFIAVPESYSDMKLGAVAIDFVMNVTGIRVLLPPYDFKGIVYGVKK